MPLANLSRPRRRVRRFGAAALSALLFGTLFASAIPFDPSGANAVTPSSSTRLTEEVRDEDPAAPQLIVAPQRPLLSVGDDEYAFEVLVRNPSEQELGGGTLSLFVGDDRLESAEELDRFLADAVPAEDTAKDGNETGEAKEAPRGAFLASVDVAPTGAEGEQAFTVAVPREALPLSAISTPGVYGFRAELLVDEAEKPDGSALEPTRLSATTTAVWRGLAFGQRVPLALVVPLVLPSDVRSMPNRDDLSEAVPRLDELLTQAEQWQATLAIDPRITAGIRAFGDAAPQPARDFLERLEASTLPVFMLQFADADPAVQAALGFTELMSPLGLSYLTRHGTFEAPPAGAAPDAAPEDGGDDTGDGPAADDESETTEIDADPTAPTLMQLLDWPAAQPGAWPAEGQVDAKTLTLLQESGVEQLVLRSDNVSGTVLPRMEIGEFSALVSDQGLEESARSAMAAQTETERSNGFAQFASSLALAAQPSSDPSAEPVDPSPLLIALDRGAVADAESSVQFVEDLATLDWIRPVGADELPSGTGTLNPGAPAEERTKLLAEAIERSEEINTLAPLLEHPGYLLQYQRVRLLYALATRHADPHVDFASVDQVIRSRDATLLDGVRVVPSENTQLVGTSSNVPVLVHNALPFDARITLRTSPTSAGITLTEQRFDNEEVGAEGNSTILVPVRSRVSSGTSGLIIQVADESNDAVFSSEVLILTIRSSYETILMIALGVLAALLLGLGVWRSILRKHRANTPAE